MSEKPLENKKSVIHCFFEQSGTFKKAFKELGYKAYDLLVALEKCNWYFNKICAEIFDEENLDYLTKVYDYLTTCDEYKKKEREIIETEVKDLGELYE